MKAFLETAFALSRRVRSGMVPIVFCLVFLIGAASAQAISTNNVPLDHWSYDALDKLAGSGLIRSDVHGMRPYTRLEVARLVSEALEAREAQTEKSLPGLIEYFLTKFQKEFSEELAIYGRGNGGSRAPIVVTPLEEAQAKYVFVSGRPRDFVNFRGGVGQFPGASGSGIVAHEGTPLLPNNEGIAYGKGSNFSFQFASSFRLWDIFSGYVEPVFVIRETETSGRNLSTLSGGQVQGRLGGQDHVDVDLLKGYAKVSQWNIELEAGRDSMWWGQGAHGTLLLTNNAAPLDMLKLSNPTTSILPWVLSYLGPFKYAFFVARLDEDREFAHPFLTGGNVIFKPHPLLEIGGSATALVGGEGRPFSPFDRDVSDIRAALHARLRLPFLRNASIYGEFGGEDRPPPNSHWYEFLFSDVAYLAGIYFPDILGDGRTDFRLEYSNNAFKQEENHIGIWYGHSQYVSGYTYEQMLLGHRMGPDAQDLFARVTHFLRNDLSFGLDYERWDRGLTVGRIKEKTDAIGADATYDINERWRVMLRYGFESAENFNLVAGDDRDNHLLMTTVKFTF